MAKKYIWSKRKDITSLDTDATNMIRDILILLGIYSDYKSNHPNITVSEFSEYYTEYTNDLAEINLYNFIGEYHQYNRGIKILRDLCDKNSIKVPARSIKRMCATQMTKNICIPTNTATILPVLFEYVYNNKILKYVFTNKILSNCSQYTPNPSHYPFDCSSSILGFLNDFLIRMEDFDYSENLMNISQDIRGTANDIIKKYNLKENCVLRNG